MSKILSILERYKGNSQSGKIFTDDNSAHRTIINKIDGIEIPIKKNSDPSTELKKISCKKMMLDKMTELVNRDVCFQDDDAEHISNFQFLVNSTLNDAIKNYINEFNEKNQTNLTSLLTNTDILFLYKGGTTMKILYEKYVKELSEHEELKPFFNSLKKNFERSDSDYSIYINPKLKDFNLHYQNINILSYLCLKGIRNVIDEQPDNNFVPFNKITNSIITNKIDSLNVFLDSVNKNVEKFPYCENLRSIEKIIGISWLDKIVLTEQIPQIDDSNIDTQFIDSPVSNGIMEFKKFSKIDPRRTDFGLTFKTNDGHEKFSRYFVPFGKRKNNIYLSVNETNEYKNNLTNASFSLHRLKINFIVYYKTKSNKYGYFHCPSELVDISILKRDASGLPLFYNHIKLEQKLYTYDYSQNNLEIRYRGYSIYGFISDLMFTLFDVAPYPWDDAKYVKRINRLLFFVLIELIINVEPPMFKLIYKYIQEIFKLSPTILIEEKNIEKITEKINDLLVIFENIKKRNELATINFLIKIKDLLNKEDLKHFLSNYVTMSKEIVLQLNLFDQAFYIPTTSITEGTIIQQLGGLMVRRIGGGRKFKN